MYIIMWHKLNTMIHFNTKVGYRNLLFLGIFSLFGDCVFGLRILLVNASLPPPEQNPISPKLFARHCLFAWLTRRLGTAHTQESSRRWVPHYWARLLILLFPLDIVSCFPSSFEGIPWWYGAWISKRCTECLGATPLDTHFGHLADPPCPYPVEEWWWWCERNFQGRNKNDYLSVDGCHKKLVISLKSIISFYLQNNDMD